MSATAQQTYNGGGTTILVRRGVVHRSLPVPCLAHLEATAIQVTLAGKPVIVLAAYLSPSRPLIGADMTACFGGALPILMVGDLNAKHVDWKSRLSTRRGKFLRDYADENSFYSLDRKSQPTIHTTPPPPRCLIHCDN